MHVGSSELKAGFNQILSVVPANTTDGVFHGDFDINESSVKVFFSNASSVYEITSNSNVETTVTDVPAGGSSDGLVNVTIQDLSSVSKVGGDLSQNEKITLTYDVISNKSMSTGDAYDFTGNSTMRTQSGTPLTEDQPIKNIPLSGKRLIGYKEYFALDTSHPTLINSTIVTEVEADSGSVDGVKFIDYVPKGTDVYNDLGAYKGAVTLYKNGNLLTEGTGYHIQDNGTVILPSGKQAYAYQFVSDGTDWSLTGGENLTVKYQMNASQSGVFYLPSTIVGFDPRTGQEVGTKVYGSIRVDVPEPLVDLQTEQGELEPAKQITIGDPVLWMKNIKAYNPNSRPAPGEFKAEIFDDASKAYVVYYDDNGERVEVDTSFVKKNGKRYLKWKDELNPLEERSYQVRVLTPPVIEVDRDVEVLEKIDKERVKVKMDVSVKNFAEETYSGLKLNLPVPYDDVIEVKDEYGNQLRFTGSKGSTSIFVDELEKSGVSTISLIYKQPYPTVIVTPERKEFTRDSPVDLEVTVINGGEEIEYPKLEIEVLTPNMEIVHADIKKLENLTPLEETKLSETFELPANSPSGEYVVKTRFRSGFETLSASTGNFVVKSGPDDTLPISTPILLLAIGGVSYLLYKRVSSLSGSNKSNY